MRNLVLVMVAALAACSQLSSGQSELPLSRVHRGVAVSNVYVATGETGYGTGAEEILRFPAGENTSTPNKTVSLKFYPDAMAVSQYNGRVAVLDRLHGTSVEVYNKDLTFLYSVKPPQATHNDLPIAVAYTSEGSLFISVVNINYYTGKVYQYNGNDTSPDATWAIQCPTCYDGEGVYAIAFSGNNEPFFEGGTEVYLCSNGPSGSCTNTGIPSYGNYDPSEGDNFIAELAFTGDIFEMKNVHHVARYSPTISGGSIGDWSYAGHQQYCTASGMIVQYLATDSNGTLYVTCQVYYTGTEASTVIEQTSNGTQYTVSGLSIANAAGAY